YLRRPELTEEKFIRSPFHANARLYRTGDLVRWTTTGELEFLGRLDGQVKVRGCRIELGEIEATLQGHAAVRENVVIVRADERGQMQLLAYVITQPDAPASTEAELFEFLRAKLPGYMVPSAI